MRLSRPSKKSAWNRGRIIGQKRPLALSDIRKLEASLPQRERWHDLALLGVALDTMLRATDLLALQVKDVQAATGVIKPRLVQAQRKTGNVVQPVLTPTTRQYLANWLNKSGKQPGHYLFTRTKPMGAAPIPRPHYAELVKSWAEWLGYDPADFSTHSLRRTKAAHMYWAGEDITLVSRLLGHKSLTHTVEYLGINQHQAEQAALRHEFLTGYTG
ncbi:tyrosine-type recombinase/integrase [Marinovum sp. 2_MG-2023]|uniref:tyrosine-type recombinase/integrase n=1 Tax=unclassified Marinovum TaxID=2647166 RepID=UPI0026E2BFA6|nr:MULTISPECIES: tyrosine-type recombinase/integrase [unclassified Marinovum]MDO6730701.1 tyrosine-type recombinase/integrase [Marinovum sp. 2_MG-2023]MDO6780094.1 tyrosine-type recombinase/integrase [Marinovum sp. 1_MG-2023]